MPRNLPLTDAQMQHYILHGYVTVKVDLPETFHRAVRDQVETVFEKEGNPGNNVLPRIPDIRQVFEHPAVDGALTALLGPAYAMHAHRHCHRNPPGSQGQDMHKDSWARLHHHTRWVMALYYPQDTPDELGPTGVLPKSHLFNTADGCKEPEVSLCGEAGTVTLVHYDLWHRARPNRSGRNRYMLKFLFTRMEEPRTPSWNAAGVAWNPVETGALPDGLNRMWAHLWNWHSGASLPAGDPPDTPLDARVRGLAAPAEAEALDAAYALAALGAPAVPALVETLEKSAEPIRRNAAYALAALGAPAVPALVEASRSENADLRACALDILGDIGLPALEAVPALIHALQDEHPGVRGSAAEALGTVAEGEKASVPALAAALGDGDDWVRRKAALTLARIGPAAEAAVPALVEVLQDDNRYVRSNAMEALRRIATPEAVDALIRSLVTARWCPSTTPESTF